MTGVVDEDPFAPPIADVVARVTGVRLASRMDRLGAFGVDAVSQSLVVGVAYTISATSGKLVELDANQEWSALETIGFIIGTHPLSWMLVSAFIGINVFTVTKYGATLGKLALGIHVARSDGERAGFWRILLLRTALWWLIIALVEVLCEFADAPGATLSVPSNLVWFIGVLMIFGPSRRCAYDYLAGTIVVRANRASTSKPNTSPAQSPTPARDSA